MVLPSKIAFVDIETTGGSVNYDRIIEIGVVRVEDGQITQTFQTLINPNHYLPPEITSLTGITAEELESAPTFRQVKQQILDVLKNCIFVAHNVRFDYGFLRNEFKREATNYSAKHFCTVKLSRTLYPQFPHHNLDAIIKRFGFHCAKRHRAFDDAKVLWEFLQVVQKSFACETLEQAIAKALKKPSVPLNISTDILESLPTSPGVYIFYGDSQLPLYIGKSINIRNRVLSHFSSDHASSTEMKIAQQIRRIETIKTAGEFGALVKEAELIKKLQPLYNRRLRSIRKMIVLKKHLSSSEYATISLETLNELLLDDLDKVIAIFRSQKQAKEYLISMSKQYHLCEKLLGIEKTTGACFGYRLKNCKGACIQKESPVIYNLRFSLAFAQCEIKPWPYAGPIMIEETDPLEDQHHFYIVDKWCLVAYGHKDEVFRMSDYIFDLDTYKIINSYLTRSKQRKVKSISHDKLESIYAV